MVELGRWEDLVMLGKEMPSGGEMVAVSHADDDDDECMLEAAEEEPAREAVEADKQQAMDKTVTGIATEWTVPGDD